ncbi:hypothetical protein BDQ17DRAFT_516585 [Cyathus striatus]|nr:hypothetical protein BDQ17DRAFT_516585 [Cyathus striatus]
MDTPSTSQFFAFKDCLARRILALPGLNSESEDSSDLDEFAMYLAVESWEIVPESLQNITYESRTDAPEDLDDLPLDSLSSEFCDSLISYGFVPDVEDAFRFLHRVMEDYLKEACTPPPVWASTRTRECEICEREVPLTYHHLIPKSTHAKVLKKKWHPESMLNSVAWLCRPCHTAVHQVARTEDLARNYYTVGLLLEREDIQKWRKYAAKQRFGVRRG